MRNLSEDCIAQFHNLLNRIRSRVFLTLPQHKREESLKRHQDWQNGLEQERFFCDVFND